MNVYDFDGTLYRGDSSLDFALFNFRRHPSLLVCLPGFVKAFCLYRMKKITLTDMKERLYRYFQKLPDLEVALPLFWKTHRRKLYSWYFDQKEPTDVIISASPAFQLQPICDELGVTLIASNVDPHTGKYDGLNCRDTEKVRRLQAQFPEAEIRQFYSDSHADQPLADLAKEAFLIRHHIPTPWH